MMENYRSAPEILSCREFLIDKNRTRIKKELQPTLPPAIRSSATSRPRRRETEWIAGR